MKWIIGQSYSIQKVGLHDSVFFCIFTLRWRRKCTHHIFEHKSNLPGPCVTEPILGTSFAIQISPLAISEYLEWGCIPPCPQPQVIMETGCSYGPGLMAASCRGFFSPSLISTTYFPSLMGLLICLTLTFVK